VTNGWFDSQLMFVCLVGIGGSALGLSALLLACWVPSRYLVAGGRVLALCLAALGGIACAQGQPREVWLSALLLAGACAALPVLHSPLWRAGATWVLVRLRDPRWLGCLVLLLSILTSAGWAHRLEQEAPPPDDFSAPDRTPKGESVKEIVPSPVYTDRGRPIRVGSWIAPNPSPIVPRPEAEVFAADRPPENAIRTAPSDPSYNCHGWTFCGGRYVLTGDQVPIILQDNGYERISDPVPGDLAVYRDESQVVHTGIVRTACGGVPILVESKWGELGRFIHPAQLWPYAGAHCEFYRSSRWGHLLRGLDSASSSAVDNQSGDPGHAR
jgi:hypothetical protein